MNLNLANYCTGIVEYVQAFYLFFTERDAFDTLFDHAPDKLNLVKKVRDNILLFKYL